ncbi:MAG: hypothetical protein N3D16_10535 [Anaerolineales bacterium]|nr:hypothetical protein [Anaerolineales bacterium]
MASKLFRVILCSAVIAAITLGWAVTQSTLRVAGATNHLGEKLLAPSVNHANDSVRTPMTKVLSPPFLQAAFGDNQPLLDKILEIVENSQIPDAEIKQSKIGLLLVTYRLQQNPTGVAVHLFGDIVDERKPAFSSEGYWRSQLPDSFYDLGQSALSFFGRSVRVLADKDTEARQRRFFDAIINNRYPILTNYLQDPLFFSGVIPDPSTLATDHFRPYLASVLIKGKVSMTGLDCEVIAHSFDEGRARELAQAISALRTLAIGLGRVRYGHSEYAELALNQLAGGTIETQGPTVFGRVALSGEVIQRALPKFVQGLSKGVGRIRRGPGYPS